MMKKAAASNSKRKLKHFLCRMQKWKETFNSLIGQIDYLDQQEYTLKDKKKYLDGITVTQI
jgi:hypothetical protein